MVIATVQNKTHGKNEVVKDGIRLNGTEAQENLDSLFDRLPHESYTKDDIFQINENEILCRMKHPIEDNEGRNRIVYIVWDKEASDDTIKNTVETIGLDYNSFLKLKNTFYKKKVQNFS